MLGNPADVDWQVLDEDTYDSNRFPAQEDPQTPSQNTSIQSIDKGLLKKFAVPAAIALALSGSGRAPMPASQAVADQLVNGHVPLSAENHPRTLPSGVASEATGVNLYPINFQRLNNLLNPNVHQEIRLKPNQPYFNNIGMGSSSGNLNRLSSSAETKVVNGYDESLNHFDIDPMLIPGHLESVESASGDGDQAWIHFVTQQGLKVKIPIPDNEKVTDYFKKYEGMDGLHFMLMPRQLQTEASVYPSGEDSAEELVVTENTMTADFVLNLDVPGQRDLLSLSGKHNDFPYYVYSEIPFEEAELPDIEVEDPKLVTMTVEKIVPFVQPDGSTIWEFRNPDDDSVVRFHERAVSPNFNKAFSDLANAEPGLRPDRITFQYSPSMLRPVITQVDNGVVVPDSRTVIDGNFGEIDMYPVISRDTFWFARAKN